MLISIGFKILAYFILLHVSLGSWTKKQKRKKRLFICVMLGNFRLQQGSMECVSPSQSVLRRHTEWELVMREKGQKKSAFGSWEDTKENKQYSLQRRLFHAAQWMHAIIGSYGPFCCIKGSSIFPQNSTLPHTEGVSSTAALLCAFWRPQGRHWEYLYTERLLGILGGAAEFVVLVQLRSTSLNNMNKTTHYADTDISGLLIC